MTSAGIEPATFQFVAQHLNHCATAVPHTGKDNSEKHTTEHTNCHSQRDGWHLPFTHIHHTFQRNPINTIKHHLFKIFSFLKQCFTTLVKLPYAGGYLKCYCMVCEKCEYYWNRNRYKLWNKWHTVKNKTHYAACLKRCNEREDLRTPHLKARIKPNGQKGAHICMGHLQISSSFAAGKGGVECWILKITVTYSKSISISDLLVIKPIISIVTVLQYDKNGRVGLREMTTNVHNLTNNDPDGIERTNLNLQMTYVWICKCS